MTSAREHLDNLRAVFQTLALTRADVSECCVSDNNRWTLWDGFQTLANPWKPFYHKGSWASAEAATGAPTNRFTPPLVPNRPFKRLWDGFQTLLGERSCDASTTSRSMTSYPHTGQGEPWPISHANSASIRGPSPRISTHAVSLVE